MEKDVGRMEVKMFPNKHTEGWQDQYKLAVVRAAFPASINDQTEIEDVEVWYEGTDARYGCEECGCDRHPQLPEFEVHVRVKLMNGETLMSSTSLPTEVAKFLNTVLA